MHRLSSTLAFRVLLILSVAVVDVAAQGSTHFRTLAGISPAGDQIGTGSAARFNVPLGLAVDSSGNLYIADMGNCALKKSTPAGVVTAFAGYQVGCGSTDGPSSVATFSGPQGVAVDSTGTVYVADTFNQTIRKITPAGVVSTLAGQPGQVGSTDGTGSAARFNNPRGIVVNSAGTVYVADQFSNVIRQITPAGVVTTYAGTAGAPGSVDGTGAAARFAGPRGLAIDNAGNLYVADSNNQTIRKIAPGAVVTTLAGTAGMFGSTNGTGAAARFNNPRGIAIDSAGTLYVADTNNQTIRQVTAAGVVTNFAGTTIVGNADGDVANARFNNPEGVAVDALGTVYISDTTNDTIRKISAGVVTTIAGFLGSLGSADGPESVARFAYPFGVAVGANRTAYVADRNNHTIRKIDAEGTVTTYAGLAGVSGAVDGPAASARFSAPRAVAVDSDGTVYVAEVQQTIRAITPGGIVSTVAGLASTSGSTDGTGSAARFFQPSGIAVDSAHNLYVADAGNHTIRKIAPGGVVTTLAGLASTPGNSDGTGSAARFNFPRAVTVDAAGDVFVADTNNHTIRKITSAGVVTTVAGQPGVQGFADGTGSAARFSGPQGIAVTSTGILYVADTNSNTMRKITNGNVVTTIEGCAGCIGSEQYGMFNQPINVAVDRDNFVYVADSRNNSIRTTATLPLGLVVDFGPGVGIWLHRGTTWRQVHPYSAKSIIRLRGQEGGILVDFGPGLGVYYYARDIDGQEFWFPLHPESPRAMIAIDFDGDGEDDAGVFDFTGYGLWLFDGDDEWSQLHGSSSSQLLVANLDGAGGDELIVDFPGYGVWARSSTGSWSLVHPADVTAIVATDLDGNGKTDLVMNFPGYGVWRYMNGSTWSPVHPYAATKLVDADLDGNNVSDLIVDFGAGRGVWIWRNATTWEQLHAQSPESIVSGDLDSDAFDEVILDFGAAGVWSYEDGTGWALVHATNPKTIVTAHVR